MVFVGAQMYIYIMHVHITSTYNYVKLNVPDIKHIQYITSLSFETTLMEALVTLHVNYWNLKHVWSEMTCSSLLFAKSVALVHSSFQMYLQQTNNRELYRLFYGACISLKLV